MPLLFSLKLNHKEKSMNQAAVMLKTPPAGTTPDLNALCHELEKAPIINPTDFKEMLYESGIKPEQLAKCLAIRKADNGKQPALAFALLQLARLCQLPIEEFVIRRVKKFRSQADNDCIINQANGWLENIRSKMPD